LEPAAEHDAQKVFVMFQHDQAFISKTSIQEATQALKKEKPS
jgi:hypothetical protein